MPHEKKSEDTDIMNLYNDGYSCEKIANIYSMSRQAVWERLKRNGIEMRKKKILPYIIYDGIKFTPSCYGYYRATSRTGHISLHRYKYEKEVGKIPDGFDIHHKDENKQNNDINNLECLSKSDHTRLYGKGINQYTKGKYENNSI